MTELVQLLRPARQESIADDSRHKAHSQTRSEPPPSPDPLPLAPGGHRVQPRQSSAAARSTPRHSELVAEAPPAAAIQNRRASHPACPVLHPPACREPLDTAPPWADPRAHRATGVASDLSWATAPGRTGLSRRECRGGGVFGRRGRSDQTRKQRVPQAPRFTGMTAVDVLGSVDELTDGTGGSVDVVTEAKIGPYRESRLNSLG